MRAERFLFREDAIYYEEAKLNRHKSYLKMQKFRPHIMARIGKTPAPPHAEQEQTD